MEKLQDLESFCKVKEAKEKIDFFIAEIHKKFNSEFKEKDSKELKLFFKESFDKFNILKTEVANDHNIDELTIMLYFSMDKVIFPAMHEKIHISDYQTITLQADGNRNNPYYASGRNIQNLYMYNYDAEAIILENNAHLFPESTKNYLLRKKEDRATVNFDILENEFQARILVSKMDQKFKIGKFKPILRSFAKTTNWETSEKTFTLLHNAVDKKYANSAPKERELVDKFLADVVNQIYKKGHSLYFLSTFGDAAIELLEGMIINRTMLNSFVRATTMYKSYDKIAILSYFLANEDLKEACNEGIYIHLCNQTNNNSLNFKDVSEELKKLAIEEAKIQFLNKQPLIKDFLLKEGFIEDYKDKFNTPDLNAVK